MSPSKASRGLNRRISVVGATGSGKSYLARALADRSGLPVYELDQIRRPEDGAEISREDFIATVAALAAQEEWIIDGHYRDVRDPIWERAQTVVWLNYPLWFVAARLIGRFARKVTRPITAAPGSAGRSEGLQASWGHRLSRLARTLRERHEYDDLLRAPRRNSLDIVELKSARQTRRWVASL